MTITSITLENFQTIAEPTRIEFSELAMLFGPNSSGKSAVSDALAIAIACCRNDPGNNEVPSYEPDRREAYLEIPNMDVAGLGLREPDFWDESDSFVVPESALSRSWRRTEEGYASHLRLGVSGKAHLDDWRWDFLWRIDEELKKKKKKKREVTEWTDSYFDFFWQNERLIHIESAGLHHGYLYINLQHHFFTEEHQELFKVVAQLVEGDQGQTLSITDKQELCVRPGAWWFTRWRHLEPTGEMWPPLASEDFSSKRVSLLKQIFENINKLVVEAGAVIGTPYNVSDSRRVPSPEQVTYLFGDDEDERELIKVGITIPNKYLGSDPTYATIASGLVAKLDNYWKGTVMEGMYSAEQLDHVNTLLSDYLFIDNGYQIDCEYVFLLSEKVVEELRDGGTDYAAGQVLLKLCVRDGRGNKFDFHEVGSGIGYSLPVLTGLSSERLQVLIKQPELHLHPALQSAMGDALLQSASPNRKLIVETHSEHICLRILRRIREASKNSSGTSDYPSANPEKVRVYYFEPRGDGTTKVHHLRISRDGDFLDPWPNGFFEERYEDLFDE